MPMPELAARLRESYAGASLWSPEARIAAFVTLGVLVLVLALARLPLGDELAIDLRDRDRLGGPVQITFVGFSVPDAAGRATLAPLVKLIFNRPLPAAFLLEIEGRVADRAPEAAVDVRVGDTVYETRFDAELGRRALHVRNPGGAREISLRVAPGSKLVIRNVNVRPEASVG